LLNIMDNKKYLDEVKNMSNTLNNYSFNGKMFCKAMSHEHRTLQQSFTGLCFEWLKICAGDNYRFDGRNEASHVLCKRIVHYMGDELRVPFI